MLLDIPSLKHKACLYHVLLSCRSACMARCRALSSYATQLTAHICLQSFSAHLQASGSFEFPCAICQYVQTLACCIAPRCSLGTWEGLT